MKGGIRGHQKQVAVEVVILLIVAWVGVSRLAESLSDRYESFYSDEAEKDGAITRGWIADDLLPKQFWSFTIFRLYGNGVPSSLRLTTRKGFARVLKALMYCPLAVRRVRNSNVSWWPSILKGNLDIAKIRSDGFDVDEVERPANSA
jgi:hypothetical protein